jgi:hypothetical protein
MAELTYEQIPPYGLMNQLYEDQARMLDPPADWLGNESWASWLARIEALLAKHCWPTYVHGTGWQGDARLNAIALTRAELGLIPEFRDERSRRRVSEHGIGEVRHGHLFDDEDAGRWAKTLMRYCPPLRDQHDLIEETMMLGIENRSGMLDLRLKAVLQRPRPYQMVVLLGMAAGTFRHREARSALTPSSISGHAFQAIVGGCSVYAALERHDAKLAKQCRAGLQRWMTDVGDRRVMGGVHYPTDSVASWIVALELAPQVFGERSILPFLKEAIRTSCLYLFLEPRVAGSPLSGAWDAVSPMVSPD